MEVLETLERRIADPDLVPDDEFESQLQALAQELVVATVSSDPETARKFESAVRIAHRATALRPSRACLACAQAIVEHYYMGGHARAALEPAEDAVVCARLVGDDAVLRRALNFRGIVLQETGDYPGAVESYALALEVAERLTDPLAAASVWSNLGGTLILAAAYRDAIACLERAIDLAVSDEREPARRIVAAARINVALAHLHLEEFGAGLRSVDQAVNELGEPKVPDQQLLRALAESIYVRLLLEAKAFTTAKDRVLLAKQYALASGLDRAEFDALMAEGLVEVHNGQVDVGLSRLSRVLERARAQKGVLRDALIAMIKAHEAAGKHDIALVYLRELMMHTGDIRKESALLHHRLHLDRLERRYASEPNTTVDRVMANNENALRHKLAKQVAKQEMVRARIEMLERLAITAELRDDASGEHCFRVGRLAALLAQEHGSDEQTCSMIDLAARLHDIGKVGIPDGILLKRGRLNEAEIVVVRAHATIGAELLAQSHEEHLKLAEDIARFHHEWWNGGGYPFGIAETAIPLAARITALADVFDTLTHDRVYRTAQPIDEALAEIGRLRGKQFDPELTDLFVAMIPRLQHEHGDLDALLSQAAQDSTLIRARRKIAETLRRAQS